jgi:hypothetical protein
MRTIYPKFKEALLSGTSINLTTADVKVVAIDTSAYTYSAAHDFLDDIPVGARIATSGNLSGKSVTNGFFDFDDVSITFGSTPPSIEALVMYIDTGSAATSRLIYYTEDDTGLPFTPGSSQVATWVVPSGGIFQI